MLIEALNIENYDPPYAMPPDAMQPHSTWIIAFCPDINSFFVTDQRAFYWEFEKEFNSEQDGVSYFEDNVQYFINVANKMIYTERVWLENTQNWYV